MSAPDDAAEIYPAIEGLPTEVSSYEIYEVYVDSGRANDLFRAFCASLGTAIEISWEDTGDV